jgi:hypothetical protein
MAGPTDFVSIVSLDKLHILLVAGGVDTALWGHGHTKSIDDLWSEIVAGESRIRRQPLQRVVPGVVNVLIRRGERELIETQQVFATGLTRHRHMPPAEKMRPGERPIDTAMRCLHEELGVARRDVEIVTSAHPPRREVGLSPSYPGLLTDYTFHTVEVRVNGLPDDDFVSDEYGVDGRTWIMRHYWTWRQA